MRAAFVTMVTSRASSSAPRWSSMPNIRKSGLIGIALNEGTHWPGPA